MSFENWWETPIVKEETEVKPEPPAEAVEEGWGVFLAKKASQLGIDFPINMLANRSMKRMEPILKDPRVKQWIDIQSEVLKKDVESFFKQPGRGKAIVAFATIKDIDRYIDNGNTGVLDISGEHGAMPMNKINKNMTFEYQCGKVRISMLADTKSILRIAVMMLITFPKEPWRNSIALVPMKPPADDELLKIVGAIENGVLVEEGLISKVKSYVCYEHANAEDKSLCNDLLGRLGEKIEPVTEATVTPEPATEGIGVKAANVFQATGWTSTILGVVATIYSFGFALKFKAIWAMILGGIGVGSAGSFILRGLEKKANQYIEKALSNPEMSAYIRSAAKDVVAAMKKQAASMKDSKYEISTKAEDIDKFVDSVFNQGFKAPGEETDDRLEKSGYFYIEKKLGEYTIICLYDTNSIKGVYVVVAIKDKNDRYGASWLRARPIPNPTSEDLKKMGFKG